MVVAKTRRRRGQFQLTMAASASGCAGHGEGRTQPQAAHGDERAQLRNPPCSGGERRGGVGALEIDDLEAR